MKQVLPPGEFVQMFDTQEKAHSHTLAQALLCNHWGVNDEKGHGVELF